MDKDFLFEDPWEPAGRAEFLLEQIAAELTEPHPLYGKVVAPVAIRADSDDVLVRTIDGYALVHLSWCKRSRPTPDFPHTLFLDDWQSFMTQVYEPDVATWREDNPENEWDAILREVKEG